MVYLYIFENEWLPFFCFYNNSVYVYAYWYFLRFQVSKWCLYVYLCVGELDSVKMLFSAQILSFVLSWDVKFLLCFFFQNLWTNYDVSGGYSPLDIVHNQMVATQSTYELSVRSKRWRKRANMHQARACHAMCVIDDNIVIFGGRDAAGKYEYF